MGTTPVECCTVTGRERSGVRCRDNTRCSTRAAAEAGVVVIIVNSFVVKLEQSVVRSEVGVPPGGADRGVRDLLPAQRETMVHSPCDPVADPNDAVFGDTSGARRDPRNCLRVRSQLMSTPITTGRWRWGDPDAPQRLSTSR